MRDLSTSRLWGALAGARIPGGSQTMSKSPSSFPRNYPGFLSHGRGAYVTDEDGYSYTDWICGLGANGLGMSHPRVTQDVQAQLHMGVSFSLPTKLETLVAQQLIDIIPCAEMVRFTKTGSEACAGAVRIARAATGRQVVVVCGYHGWHDWYAVTMPQHPGVPEDLSRLVRSFTYNDIGSLRTALGSDVAAVIMEPVLHEAPTPGFLAEVRRLADLVGALLIFDENVTGFRTAVGGAQSYYGVTPDLAVFGKAMSSGFPLAAIVGRADLLRHAQFVSGTFGGEAVSLMAAKATMSIYRETSCIPAMHGVGTLLLAGLRDALSTDFTVDGLPWKPRVTSHDPLKLAGLVQGMAHRGHLIHPKGFYISCAHTGRDVQDLCNAAFDAAADSLDDVVPPTGTNWLRT